MDFFIFDFKACFVFAPQPTSATLGLHAAMRKAYNELDASCPLDFACCYSSLHAIVLKKKLSQINRFAPANVAAT